MARTLPTLFLHFAPNSVHYLLISCCTTLATIEEAVYYLYVGLKLMPLIHLTAHGLGRS